MLGLGIPEMVLIMIAALLIFGPKKLPEIGQSVGKALREFKKGMNDLKDNFDNVIPEDDILSPKAPSNGSTNVQDSNGGGGVNSGSAAPTTPTQAPLAATAPSTEMDAKASSGVISNSDSEDSLKSS